MEQRDTAPSLVSMAGALAEGEGFSGVGILGDKLSLHWEGGLAQEGLLGRVGGLEGLLGSVSHLRGLEDLLEVKGILSGNSGGWMLVGVG